MGKGDRVGAILPNGVDAIVFMLAANSIGAPWSALSPDSGVKIAADRLGRIAPKVLVSVRSYRYNGKAHTTCTQSVDGVAAVVHAAVGTLRGRLA